MSEQLITIHGVTIDGPTLATYFPSHPDFHHFRLSLEPQAANEYNLKVAACDSNENVIADLDLPNSTSDQPIRYENWHSGSVKIRKESQLEKVAKKKFLFVTVKKFKLINLEISPKYYKDPRGEDEYTAYSVKITREKI